MHELYELKENLIKELEEYGKANELSAPMLDKIDKLAHAAKNVCKVIETNEEEYSSRPYRMSNGDWDNSYARGRRRDSMGRYSRNDDLTGELRDLMNRTSDSRTQQDIQRMISRMEQM